MKRISILIIDSDVLARQAIAHVLYREDSFGIVGVRGHAEDPVRHIANNSPDIVLLNVGSVKNDGLALLKLIRSRFPDLPVVILSPRTKEGAVAAIAALRLGAVDFVTKPEFANTILFAERHFNKRLIPIIRSAADPKNKDRKLAMNQKPVISTPYDEKSRPDTANLITVGGCTGGPKALFSIIPQLPSDLPVPVVVVQHFPRAYTKVLVEELDEKSDISVREAYDGADLTPGVVWIAPGGYHCEIHRNGYRDFIRCHRGQRENDNRPSIDALFRSASYIYGGKVLGMILSGWGNDGLAGSEAIHRAGGKIMVQDPKSALVPELPLSVLRTGLTDEYYSVGELTRQIVRLAAHDKIEVSKKLNLQQAGSRLGSDSGKNQDDLFYSAN